MDQNSKDVQYVEVDKDALASEMAESAWENETSQVAADEKKLNK